VSTRRDLAQRSFYRVSRAIVLTPFKAIFRVRVRGRGNVPRRGAYVVAPSHRSLMDIFFAPYITPRRVRFMAKEELFKNRVLAWLFETLGGFPVARGSADRTALRAAQDALQRGEPVVIFPEGTRGHGSELGPLYNGAAYLAARLHVPLLPVGIGGSEKIMPSGAAVPRPRKVAIVVGEPLLPPAPDGRVRRRDIADLTAALRTELQLCFDEALELAGAVPTSDAATIPRD
jgi:1-acyl-sn-glycerol-3-phosphate acyltransferase